LANVARLPVGYGGVIVKAGDKEAELKFIHLPVMHRILVFKLLRAL
jgi:hypothetical protein